MDVPSLPDIADTESTDRRAINTSLDVLNMCLLMIQVKRRGLRGGAGWELGGEVADDVLCVATPELPQILDSD